MRVVGVLSLPLSPLKGAIRDLVAHKIFVNKLNHSRHTNPVVLLIVA